MIRNRVISLTLGLRSRSIRPSAIPIQSRVSTSLSGATEKEKIPPFTEAEFQRALREFLEANVEQFTRPPFPFDLGAKFTHPDKAIMAVLSDFVAKNWHLPVYPGRLMELLESRRMRELGVGYNVIPIPDKQEWKASWHEEGKPSWLGTIPTDADGRPRMFYTASIAGYTEKDGGKGGYGVILFDYYGRPKVASVGVNLKGSVPLIYYELQGVRSALQLAFDHGGYDAVVKLYCNSNAVRSILGHCLELTSSTPVCMGKVGPWQEGHKLCSACVGLHLIGCIVTEDIDLLFPVITEILELLYKTSYFTTVHVINCRGSGHLAKHLGMSTTEEEINRSGLLVDKLGSYEMVMKPDGIPEEVDDSIYNEVFKGDRVHSTLIMVEKMSKANEYTHPRALYDKLRRFGTYEMHSDEFANITPVYL